MFCCFLQCYLLGESDFLIYITDFGNAYKECRVDFVRLRTMVAKKKIVKKKEKEGEVEGIEDPEILEEVEEVEEKEPAMKLSDLPGVGPAAVEKLEAAGIFDLMGVAVLGPKELGDMAGLGEAAARKAIQASRGMMDLGFQDGLEFADKRKEVVYISTGSNEFNALLGGKGVETKAITEAFGSYGSGKTQLGLSLAVNVQMPKEQGGVEGKSVYIDTEGTFRPERIKQIAEAKGLNPESVLKNILVARAFNSDHQILLIDKVGELIKNGEPVKVVIVDSLTAHFRAEFSGRGQLADRQQKLNKYLHNLMKMAEQFNLAVYVTNQVMSNPAMMFGDPTTAIGGNIVGHASTYRIYIRRGKKGSRVAKLIDSPNLPDNECVFFVTEKGVCDDE
jgi:DNA repair protein RadA